MTTFFHRLSKYRLARYFKLIYFLWDVLLLNLAQLSSFYLRFQHLKNFDFEQVRTVFLLTNLIWIALVLYHDSYKIIRVERIETTLRRTFKILVLHALIISFFIIALKYYDVSRLRLLYFYLLFMVYLVLFRYLFMKIIKGIRVSGYNFKQVLIVGATPSGLKIAETLTLDLSYGYRVVGFADDEVHPEVRKDTPVICDLEGIASYVVKYKIDEMYIALGIHKAHEITRLIKLGERFMIRVKIIPDFQEYTKTKKVLVDFYENTPVLTLRQEPLEQPLNRIAKKIFDVVFALGVIVLIFPWLFPILIMLIKLGSKGPVFFKQARTGEDQQAFTCLKFRTMRVNTLSDELQATKNDPRITKLGAFMRKTNLDELPQFFNVLSGSMSVVGPRPHMLRHTEQYSELINNYLVRHFAKPGITGWAQVNGYRGETKKVEDMKHRVECDIWYIENWTFLLDLKIIWRTVTNIFRGEKNAF